MPFVIDMDDPLGVFYLEPLFNEDAYKIVRCSDGFELGRISGPEILQVHGDFKALTALIAQKIEEQQND